MSNFKKFTFKVTNSPQNFSFSSHDEALQNVGSLVGYLFQQCVKHDAGLNQKELEGFTLVLSEITDNICKLSDESDRLRESILPMLSSFTSAN